MCQSEVPSFSGSYSIANLYRQHVMERVNVVIMGSAGAFLHGVVLIVIYLLVREGAMGMDFVVSFFL